MFWYFTALELCLTLTCQRLRRMSPSLPRSGDVSDIGPPLVRVKAFLLTHSVLNLPGHARDKSNPSLHTAVGKKSQAHGLQQTLHVSLPWELIALLYWNESSVFSCIRIASAALTLSWGKPQEMSAAFLDDELNCFCLTRAIQSHLKLLRNY